ncbi:MAG: winged helix-turn-helix domain-containing protein [Euzebyaceae bacterium]|nr:winged helix-turn-helix domain-containing protein [Euzebyaceae bacterium]
MPGDAGPPSTRSSRPWDIEYSRCTPVTRRDECCGPPGSRRPESCTPSHVTRRANENPRLVEAVRQRIRDSGPITAADLEQRVDKLGSWWSWDDGKVVLEHLFHRGEVVVVRRKRDFTRLYDLPERVLPASALDAPTPTEAEARKELLAIAARSMGVATLEDMADYHRQWRPRSSKPLVAELVEEGVLLPVTVEGWTKPAYLHRDAKLPRAVDARALLSPFDSLVWHRDRNERLFDFHYRIEIYTPAPKRVYGYYVLPYLLGDRIVGRVDLKADRPAGVLRVQGAYAEPGVDTAAAASPLIEELRLMAEWLELDIVASADRGELAEALRRAGRPRLEQDHSE